MIAQRGRYWWEPDGEKWSCERSRKVRQKYSVEDEKKKFFGQSENAQSLAKFTKEPKTTEN
jgi:hypothetical protein